MGLPSSGARIYHGHNEPDRALALGAGPPMKPTITLGTATSPDGHTLVLRRRDTEYVIAIDGFTLMVSTMHRSESEMVALGSPAPLPGAQVLIGGLGMGYTLRAALDHYPSDAVVVVAELIPEVIEWNRGELGELTGRPLDDPRVVVHQADVAHIIRSNVERFDAILLDVDNGPDSLVYDANYWLYTPAGLAAVHRALSPGGALAVWSASEEPDFPSRLEAAGMTASVRKIRSHGSRALVYLGRT